MTDDEFINFPTVIFGASDLPLRGRYDRIETYYQNSARDLAEWLVDAEDENVTWKQKYFHTLDLYKGSQSLNGGYFAEVVRLREEVERLQPRSEVLAKLEAAGVDNWEGYGEVFQDEDIW